MKHLFAALMLASGSALASFTSSTTQIGVPVAKQEAPIQLACWVSYCGYIWSDHEDRPEEATDPRVATYLWSD